MLWNIGLLAVVAAVVGGAVFLLDKPIRRHPHAGILGAVAIAGGFILILTDLDSGWLRVAFSMALISVGSSSIGTARRARRQAADPGVPRDPS